LTENFSFAQNVINKPSEISDDESEPNIEEQADLLRLEQTYVDLHVGRDLSLKCMPKNLASLCKTENINLAELF